MPSTRVIITGLNKIDRKLKQLPYRVQGKVVRPAMRAGLKVMSAAVKAEVPVLSGATKAGVKVRAVKRRKRGSIELEVVIKADDRLKKTSPGGKTVFYPAIVEYGRRGVPPDPFMHRAFTAKGESARKVTIRALKSGVDREVKAL